MHRVSAPLFVSDVCLVVFNRSFFLFFCFLFSLATMQKYNKVEEILNEFYPLRLKMYQKRKLHQLKEMNAKLKKLKNKTTFLTMVSKGEINLINRKKIDLEQDLLNLNFIPETNLMDTNDEEEGMVGESTSGTKSVGHSSAAAGGGGAASATTRSNFDYLLRTPLSSITLDHVEASIRETESLLELKSILENTKEGKGRGAWCCRRCCGSLTWDIIFFACLLFFFLVFYSVDLWLRDLTNLKKHLLKNQKGAASYTSNRDGHGMHGGLKKEMKLRKERKKKKRVVRKKAAVKKTGEKSSKK